MSKHPRITNSRILDEFPTLESAMANKTAKRKSKAKKSRKKHSDFWKNEFERRENNGEEI